MELQYLKKWEILRYGRGIKKIASTRPGRLVGNSVRHLARGTANVAKETAKAAGRGAINLAKRAPTALVGGMIGMAAGIAGDELGDIAKYTGAGVGIGGALGYGVASSTGSFISDSYYEGAYNDEEKIEKYKDERSNDKKLQQKLSTELKHEDGSKLTKGELREAGRKVADYEASGLDEKSAIKATKMEAEVRKALMEKGQDEESAGKQARINMEVIAKEAANYDVKSLRKPEVQTEFIDRMKGKFKAAGCSDKESVAQARDLLEMVMKFKKA